MISTVQAAGRPPCVVLRIVAIIDDSLVRQIDRLVGSLIALVWSGRPAPSVLGWLHPA